MPLADDFRASLRTLPDAWSEARFELTFEEGERAARATALFGALGALRRGTSVLFSVSHDDPGRSPASVLRAVRRIERERLGGQLELVESATREDEPAPAGARTSPAAAAWDEEAAKLPPDWTDVYAELQVSSTDYLDRAALLLAPVNPSRVRERPAYRFRVARSFGYGASPQMARRCLERLDEAGITGELRIQYVLSDTKPVATQGPVLYRSGQVL